MLLDLSVPAWVHCSFANMQCQKRVEKAKSNHCALAHRCSGLNLCCMCHQEVAGQLETVYAAAPLPEDYMKYQLHMRTGLDVPRIEAWFQARRARDAAGGPPGKPAGAPRLQQDALFKLHWAACCFDGSQETNADELGALWASCLQTCRCMHAGSAASGGSGAMEALPGPPPALASASAESSHQQRLRGATTNAELDALLDNVAAGQSEQQQRQGEAPVGVQGLPFMSLTSGAGSGFGAAQQQQQAAANQAAQQQQQAALEWLAAGAGGGNGGASVAREPSNGLIETLGRHHHHALQGGVSENPAFLLSFANPTPVIKTAIAKGGSSGPHSGSDVMEGLPFRSAQPSGNGGVPAFPLASSGNAAAGAHAGSRQDMAPPAERPASSGRGLPPRGARAAGGSPTAAAAACATAPAPAAAAAAPAAAGADAAAVAGSIASCTCSIAHAMLLGMSMLLSARSAACC